MTTQGLRAFQFNDEDLVAPIYLIGDLYEDDGDKRTVGMPHDVLVSVNDTLEKVGWSVSDGTMHQYAPYIRNYFALAAHTCRDPYHLQTLRDWIYALAYPRLEYLRSVGNGLHAEKPRHEPGLGKGSLVVATAAIGQAWAVSGRQSPSDYASWRKWIQGLFRRLRQPKDRKAALLRDDILHMVRACENHPYSLVGLRNKALILLGWSAALRCSEIGAIQTDHVVERNGNWFCRIPKSKTDQAGEGYLVPLYGARDPRLDPLLAWRRWIEDSRISSGYAFRSISAHGKLAIEKGLSHQGIADIIKAYTSKPNVSAHSLRIGYITQAKLDGHENWRVRRVSRHQSDAMIDVYTRPDRYFEEGPGSLL